MGLDANAKIRSCDVTLTGILNARVCTDRDQGEPAGSTDRRIGKMAKNQGFLTFLRDRVSPKGAMSAQQRKQLGCTHNGKIETENQASYGTWLTVPLRPSTWSPLAQRNRVCYRYVCGDAASLPATGLPNEHASQDRRSLTMQIQFAHLKPSRLFIAGPNMEDRVMMIPSLIGEGTPAEPHFGCLCR